MAYTRAWDETFPPDTQPANQLGLDVRQVKQDLRERITSFGAGPLVDRPTPDDEFGNANFGVTYFSVDTGQHWRWNGSSWVDITPNTSIQRFINVTPVNLVDPNPTGLGQALVIPASTFQIGDIIKIHARFQHTVGSGFAAVGAVRFGNVADFGSSIAAGTVPMPGAISWVSIEALGFIATAATAIFYSDVNIFSSGTLGANPNRNAIAGLNLANPIYIAETLAGGAVGNTFVFELLMLEIMRM